MWWKKSDSNVFNTFQALPKPHLTYTPFKLCFFRNLSNFFLAYLFILFYFFKKQQKFNYNLNFWRSKSHEQKWWRLICAKYPEIVSITFKFQPFFFYLHWHLLFSIPFDFFSVFFHVHFVCHAGLKIYLCSSKSCTVFFV